MSKSSLALVAILGMPLTLVTGAVAQTVPQNLPAALMCYAKADQSWRVGYLHRVNKNGEAIYLSPDGRLSGTVNAKGVVEAPTNRPAGVDCYGKTLDELRSSGRIMDFQRTK
jgi:hypothetical protein